MAEYQRIVIFRLGRLFGIKGPGLVFVIPIIDRVMKLDLRTRVIDVPKQRVITKDNVTVDVDAVVYYRVTDPKKAVVEVQRYEVASSLLAQTTLRDILGQKSLDELLSKREELNKKLQSSIDKGTDPWGIKVNMVEIKHVDLPQEMQRAHRKTAYKGCHRVNRCLARHLENRAQNGFHDHSDKFQKSKGYDECQKDRSDGYDYSNFNHNLIPDKWEHFFRK